MHSCSLMVSGAQSMSELPEMQLQVQWKLGIPRRVRTSKRVTLLLHLLCCLLTPTLPDLRRK